MPMDTILLRRSDVCGVTADVVTMHDNCASILANAIKEDNCSRKKPRVSQKASYDCAHRSADFRLGNMVLTCNYTLSDATAGFASVRVPRWLGPLEIGEMFSQLNHLLKHPRSSRTSGLVQWES